MGKLRSSMRQEILKKGKRKKKEASIVINRKRTKTPAKAAGQAAKPTKVIPVKPAKGVSQPVKLVKAAPVKLAKAAPVKPVKSVVDAEPAIPEFLPKPSAPETTRDADR